MALSTIGTNQLDTTDNINFGDNDKAQFGAGNDLQVYHDASHSYVSDAGTGNLQLSTNGTAIKMLRGNGEVLGSFNIGGSVDLYHSNAKKFETTATGVNVTGGLNTTANVGIGTVSPDRKFHIQTADNIIGLIESTDADAWLAFKDNTSSSDNAVRIGATGDNLRFYAGSAERMRIFSNGEINVAGKSSNANNIGNTYFHVQNANRGHDLRFAKSESGSFDALVFYHSGSAVGYISYGNTSTSYNTSSDYRLKENVADITGATDRLKQLNPVRFNFIADADTTVDGFLAHEVQDIVPEAITGTKDAVDDDGNAVMQGIDQSKLVPLLVAALQEQQTAIEALTARVTALEAN